MKKLIFDFVKNLKQYMNYILKLGFKDLFINFIEIIMLVILSCLIYIPVGLISDVFYQLICLFVNESVLFFSIYNIIFSLISAIAAIYFFINMFNNRYSDIDKLRKKEKQEKEVKVYDSVERKKTEDDLDLPKKKDD